VSSDKKPDIDKRRHKTGVLINVLTTNITNNYRLV